MIYLPWDTRKHAWCWESFIIRLDILTSTRTRARWKLRIFHYSPWYTYTFWDGVLHPVENLSLFALIYLAARRSRSFLRWESFIIRLDILSAVFHAPPKTLRIFHYSPWYTYARRPESRWEVENLSLFALIYLHVAAYRSREGWESFIIRLDILRSSLAPAPVTLRIFHYSPWYTYRYPAHRRDMVENLSLFALIYLLHRHHRLHGRWESFIIRLDILTSKPSNVTDPLRIFHYSPWYTYVELPHHIRGVENLSLFALIYLWGRPGECRGCWESFIIRLDILNTVRCAASRMLRIFHYSPWYT